jgi:protein-disulfide isomerase
MKRRQILIGAASTALLSIAPVASVVGPLLAEESMVHPDDRVLGAAEAPITMIEYSSLTCPHCAAFHAGALPEIKKTWIAEGKLRLVYRHFPLDGLGLRAAAVANCIEGERHFAFLDLLFENQKRWASSPDPLKILGQYAGLAGLNQQRFDACVGDEAEMDRILKRAQEGRTTYDVNSTPTLIVNGRKVEGARSIEDFNAIFSKIAPRT